MLEPIKDNSAMLISTHVAENLMRTGEEDRHPPAVPPALAVGLEARPVVLLALNVALGARPVVPAVAVEVAVPARPVVLAAAVGVVAAVVVAAVVDGAGAEAEASPGSPGVGIMIVALVSSHRMTVEKMFFATYQQLRMVMLYQRAKKFLMMSPTMNADRSTAPQMSLAAQMKKGPNADSGGSF